MNNSCIIFSFLFSDGERWCRKKAPSPFAFAAPVELSQFVRMVRNKNNASGRHYDFDDFFRTAVRRVHDGICVLYCRAVRVLLLLVNFRFSRVTKKKNLIVTQTAPIIRELPFPILFSVYVYGFSKRIVSMWSLVRAFCSRGILLNGLVRRWINGVVGQFVKGF